MSPNNYSEIFNQSTLAKLFPASRADEFFEALFGDASEGSYDITLAFNSASETTINFDLNLSQRPGCCLVCNLTYGLPDVFSRHPIINISGLVNDINNTLGDKATCGDWKLQSTQSVSSALHIIPLTIDLK